MNKLKIAFLFSVFLILLANCKTTSVLITKNDIVGTWEGCDGRQIVFSENTEGEIIGHLAKLGKLERYKFTLNEEAYRVKKQSHGVYTGVVKWQNLNGKETWEKVTITIENDVYTDDGSDSCSKEMKRI